MSMSRKPRKIHPTDSDKVSDREGSDTKASSEREQESETHKVEHRDFGGTVSESVAEILKRIPVLQPDSDALRQETLDASRESQADHGDRDRENQCRGSAALAVDGLRVQNKLSHWMLTS